MDKGSVSQATAARAVRYRARLQAARRRRVAPIWRAALEGAQLLASTSELAASRGQQRAELMRAMKAQARRVNIDELAREILARKDCFRAAAAAREQAPCGCCGGSGYQPASLRAADSRPGDRQ